MRRKNGVHAALPSHGFPKNDWFQVQRQITARTLFLLFFPNPHPYPPRVNPGFFLEHSKTVVLGFTFRLTPSILIAPERGASVKRERRKNTNDHLGGTKIK